MAPVTLLYPPPLAVWVMVDVPFAWSWSPPAETVTVWFVFHVEVEKVRDVGLVEMSGVAGAGERYGDVCARLVAELYVVGGRTAFVDASSAGYRPSRSWVSLIERACVVVALGGG